MSEALLDAPRVKRPLSGDFHPCADLFPLMVGEEFAALVADIKANGLKHPIVELDGAILDGRNRYRACLEADRPIRSEKFKGKDPRAYVLSANLERRHLNESQRAMIAAKLATLPPHRPLGSASIEALSQPEAAQRLRVSRAAVQRAAVVREKGIPQLIEAVESGNMSVSLAMAIAEYKTEFQYVLVSDPPSSTRELRRRVASIERDRLAGAQDVGPLNERCMLSVRDVASLVECDADSVDWIITDPPYPREFLPVFEDLARGAAHVLKDGGGLLCMIGQSYLPEIIAAMTPHLTYHWTLAYLTPGGQAVQIFPRKVNTFWKPILVFTKGEFTGEWFGDVSRSEVNDNDKDHHHWGQSVSGMHDLVERFVKPGDVVMDPFLGGGATAIAALELGCKFIGSDLEQDAIDKTRARLADVSE
jgi:16S rRNA G966 N2-methylase RsmD